MEPFFTHTWTVIVAGGQGTRLFPISHKNCPKQFCELDKENTFIQATVKRFIAIGVDPKHIVTVVTSDQQRWLAEEQLKMFGIPTQNTHQIPDYYGYVGAMVSAADFINKLDEDAVIINTPADQYVEFNSNFELAIKSAVASAKRGFPTIVGVHVNDINTIMGCGHAKYRVEDYLLVIDDFIEKPEQSKAEEIANHPEKYVCNTGINIWKATTILGYVSMSSVRTASSFTKDSNDVDAILNTNYLMTRMKDDLKVMLGKFEWYDCGTLQSLYDVSEKHGEGENVFLGAGEINCQQCEHSLFYAPSNVELRVTKISDAAVVVNRINNKIVIVVIKFSESQEVRALAEDFIEHAKIINKDFAFGARNNVVPYSDISDDICVGFVGVDGHIVYAHKRRNNSIEVAVSPMMV